MKVAIGGKGGVGKTTIAASMAKVLALRGYRVLAIDADPNATLGSAFGLEGAEEIVPIVKMEALIEERTGARPGSAGGLFKMNPRVDDIPDRFAREVDEGIRLMVMGAIKSGGSGCYCPENVMLRVLVAHMLLARKEAVVMDMEAGIEHLGRGTARAVDHLIIVVEPGRRSLETAQTVRTLAADLGLERVSIIGNKVRGPKDEAFLREGLSDFNILGFIPYSEKIIEADMEGRPPYVAMPELLDRVGEIVAHIIGP